jgi:YegS/Rv2252/BmrU family lipid kinase
MVQRRNITFVVNPHSGTSVTKPDHELFSRYMDPAWWSLETKITKAPGDATLFASEAVAANAHAVVAVGGDGTVNEIAKALCHTNTALGIIPCGSGNGLARHHGIPMRISEAVKIINRFHSVPHDAVSINGHLSFNVSGIGFDAHVAELFARAGSRGFSTYFKLVIREFGSYFENSFTIDISGAKTASQAYMVSVANASQFGNGAVISPEADTSDGKVNLVMVRRMPLWKLPMFIIRVFNRSATRSPWVTSTAGSSATITCASPAPLHIDGEPCGNHRQFEISVIRHAIRMIVP